MIYKIKEYKNKLIEKAYRDGMKESNAFFGTNWVYGLPNVLILNNRKEIDNFMGQKSMGRSVGFSGHRIVYILDNNNMEKESIHKKLSDADYYTLIKHEICHLFYYKYSHNCIKPKWLWEGVSIYLSKQTVYTKPKSFLMFIDSDTKNVDSAFYEGGFAVKLLIENFGKKKILKLISRSSEVKNKNEFSKLFKKIYNFDLNYKNFNNLLKKNK